MKFPTKQLSLLLRDEMLQYGIVQPGREVAGGVPIVRVQDVGTNGQLDMSNPIRVAPEISRKHRRTVLEGNELLITLVGSVGNTAVAPAQTAGWNVARAIGVMRPVHNVEARWLKLCFETDFVKTQIESKVNTTVQRTLNLADLKTLQVPFPEPAVRSGIATALGALDQKIVANAALARTAELLSRTHFFSWVSGAEMRSLSAISPPFLGGTPDRANPNFWGPGSPWASARDVAAARSGVLINTNESITAAACASATRLASHPIGTTFLTARGTVGAIARTAVPSSINQSCYAFRAPAGRSALLYLAVAYGVERMRAMAHGSVFATITMPTIATIQVPDVCKFSPQAADLAESLLDVAAQAIRENGAILELRNVLLPALMSGQLRIKYAERRVEDAT